MGWVSLGTFQAAPYPSEAWTLLSLPGSYPGGVRGFSLSAPPGGYPVNWSSLARWQAGEFVEGVGTVGPLGEVSNYRAAGIPFLTILTDEMLPRVPGNVTGQFILISVHRWVVSRGVEFWVYSV